ncbi:MAG: hypothetical protein ACLPTF_25710 [Steroidobacteraceae bacterium]
MVIRLIVHQAGELERTHEHGSVAPHGVGRLRAKAARFDTVGAGRLQRLLREGVHGTARVAKRAEYLVRALHDDGEIGAHGVPRLARTNPGKTEDEQQIGFAAGGALEAQADAGRLGFGFALAARAAVGPVDFGVDGARHPGAKITVARG